MHMALLKQIHSYIKFVEIIVGALCLIKAFCIVCIEEHRVFPSRQFHTCLLLGPAYLIAGIAPAPVGFIIVCILYILMLLHAIYILCTKKREKTPM